MLIGHSMTDKEKIRMATGQEGSKIYFIGIGGESMSALAELSLLSGHRVYGSDKRKNSKTELLQKHGAVINYCHNGSEIYRIMPTLVVFSLAIDSNNPEYKKAVELGITTVSRAEFLGVLIDGYQNSVGVSGSHGKSTTVAMLYKMLSAAGMAPTVIGGAELSEGSSFIRGEERALIYEACEYGDSFLHFSPDIGIFLNLDLDHTDYFNSLSDIKESFAKAASRSKRLSVINADDENLKDILGEIPTRIVTFSQKDGADYKFSPKNLGCGIYEFDLYRDGEELGKFSPGTRGEFNLVNAVAAAVAAITLGIDTYTIRTALSEFRGIPRRLEFLCKYRGADVYYDYAHHPREIAAAKEALQNIGYKNICAVFAPHTYSRTKSFFREFASELSGFAQSCIADIYGAREMPIVGITASALADSVRSLGGRSTALGGADISKVIDGACDCIVLMGAGDLEEIKAQIINDSNGRM